MKNETEIRWFKYSAGNGDEYLAKTTGDNPDYEYRCTKRASGMYFNFDGDGWILSEPNERITSPASAYLTLAESATEITDKEAQEILFIDEI